MSMESYTVSGYGFPVETVKGYDILKFLKNHADEEKFSRLWNERGEKLFDAVKNINLDDFEYMKDKYFYELDTDEPAAEKLIDALNDISYDSEDAKDVIAAIIGDEFGDIEIAYECGQSDECRGCASILLHSGLPWQFADTEKRLTEESFCKLLAPYAEELGVDTAQIGELEIEYFG